MIPDIPRFAIALAAYNGLKHLAEQCETILLQEAVVVTLFISVDSSQDGTEEWVQVLASSNPRVVLLPIGAIFGGASANFFHLLRVIDFSEFDYLAFADQDDIWHLDKLSRAHDQLLKNDAAGYSSNVMAFWPDGRQKLVVKAHPQREWDYVFESAGPGCTYVMRRSLALELQSIARDKANALSSVVYHDWLAYAYARAHGFKWVIDDYAGMLYRQHAHNQLGANFGFSSFMKRLKQVISGDAFQQAIDIADIVGSDETNKVRLLLRGGPVNALKLACLSFHCRRKRSHQLYFFISCLWFAVRKPAFLSEGAQ